MRTITDLRNELAEINKGLNKIVRKCGTRRNIAKLTLAEREAALAQLRELEEAKRLKLLVICSINRPVNFN